MTIGNALNMSRIVPDIREYVTLEQAGLLMKAAYQMGLKRGRCVPDARVLEIEAVVGGEG